MSWIFDESLSFRRSSLQQKQKKHFTLEAFNSGRWRVPSNAPHYSSFCRMQRQRKFFMAAVLHSGRKFCGKKTFYSICVGSDEWCNWGSARRHIGLQRILQQMTSSNAKLVIYYLFNVAHMGRDRLGLITVLWLDLSHKSKGTTRQPDIVLALVLVSGKRKSSHTSNENGIQLF